MAKNKILLSISVVLLVFLGLFIFRNSLPTSIFIGTDIRAIKKRGVLKLVTAYNPTGFFLYKDQKMGFEYDFIEKFAESIGVRLQVIVVNQPEEMRQKLLKGEADIMAYNIPIMNLPMQFVEFSHSYVQTELVLVQRKVNKKSPEYVGSVNSLAGRTVSVTEQSAYLQTLSDIRFDLNNNLNVNIIGDSKSPEDLIRMVADSEINYTVANREIALINKSYYKNLDIETTITPPQDIAFTIHRKHRNLLRTLNRFIDNSRKDQTLYALYNQYFKTSRLTLETSNTANGNNDVGLSTEAISVYDGLIQKYAAEVNWDWRLVASLIWQESKFKPTARSWAGATGLMQLMPATARRFGLNTMQEIYQPELNIKTGTKYIAWLENFWKEIQDDTERKKFIMGSYNAGEGHVKDAQRLAKKYGYDTQKWDGNVEYFLLNKSKPAFYNDPVCKYGYCRGSEPFNYVRSIIKKYSLYTAKYSANHTAAYNFSLDFSPIYDMGLNDNSSSTGLVKKQLFEKKDVFQERSILNTDTHNSVNNLKPRNPDRMKMKENAPPSNQLFRKKDLFRK
ncbi:MAG TPA: transglycosylase SLT domain-containing protein [Chitinophagales bacterium]|nr:transglycosylase SLT domain-containing protein [Chitinophagales bacterium]